MKISFKSIILASAFIFASVLIAEDEVKKESKPPEESSSKEEIKDVEVSGVIIKKGMVGFGRASPKAPEDYFYMIKTKGSFVYIPNKIGEKEIDFEPFLGKEVIAKGKAKVTVNKENKEKFKRITELASIELKITPDEKIEKPAEKKKEEETK